MRLGIRTKEVIDDVVHQALAGERSIVVPVCDERTARRLFAAVSDRIERLGGCPNRVQFKWNFSNGSEIRFGTTAVAE